METWHITLNLVPEKYALPWLEFTGIFFSTLLLLSDAYLFVILGSDIKPKIFAMFQCFRDQSVDC